MHAPTLLANPRQLRLQCISASEKTITLIATTIQPRASCPRCQQSSTRVHSHYVRTVADLPWLGVAVRLELHTRCFFCRQPRCQQQLFCERLPAMVAPYARRTQRLALALPVLGFALGGEAGARLALVCSMSTSADTLLRSIRRAALSPPPPPR